MSLLDSELQDGLSEMEADQADDGVAQSFTFGGYEWPCSLGTRRRGSVEEIGGKIIVYDFSLRVRINALDVSGAKTFSDMPVPIQGNDLAQDGTGYTIEFVQTALGSHYALFLISQGA